MEKHKTRRATLKSLYQGWVLLVFGLVVLAGPVRVASAAWTYGVYLDASYESYVASSPIETSSNQTDVAAIFVENDTSELIDIVVRSDVRARFENVSFAGTAAGVYFNKEPPGEMRPLWELSVTTTGYLGAESTALDARDYGVYADLIEDLFETQGTVETRVLGRTSAEAYGVFTGDVACFVSNGRIAVTAQTVASGGS